MTLSENKSILKGIKRLDILIKNELSEKMKQVLINRRDNLLWMLNN